MNTKLTRKGFFAALLAAPVVAKTKPLFSSRHIGEVVKTYAPKLLIRPIRISEKVWSQMSPAMRQHVGIVKGDWRSSPDGRVWR